VGLKGYNKPAHEGPDRDHQEHKREDDECIRSPQRFLDKKHIITKFLDRELEAPFLRFTLLR
jgi:hypothetical protein